MHIPEISDDGVTPVVREYSDEAIAKFIRFVTRPNRYVIANEVELVFDRVQKLRKELIQTRKHVAPLHEYAADELLADARIPVVSTIDVSEMSDEELLTFSDQVATEVESRTNAMHEAEA